MPDPNPAKNRQLNFLVAPDVDDMLQDEVYRLRKADRSASATALINDVLRAYLQKLAKETK
jgi:hypothetical protein